MTSNNLRKELVQSQFGSHAAGYVGSKVHAQGASLARLVELLAPQPDWHVLDVATAAGHTALALAPHVAQVTAVDITPEMLPLATDLAAQRGIANITIETADAEELPYAAACFDLVTCRIAPHHFPHVDRFLSEAARVLRAGGRLAVVDNIVPDREADAQTQATDVSGEDAPTETTPERDVQDDAAPQQPAARSMPMEAGDNIETGDESEAGDYINAFEKLRDPSHVRALSLAEWRAAFRAAGFIVEHDEIAPKAMEFMPWAERMGASTAVIAELRRRLQEAPPAAAAYFALNSDGQDWIFHLHEAILIGRKP